MTQWLCDEVNTIYGIVVDEVSTRYDTVLLDEVSTRYDTVLLDEVSTRYGSST